MKYVKKPIPVECYTWDEVIQDFHEEKFVKNVVMHTNVKGDINGATFEINNRTMKWDPINGVMRIGTLEGEMTMQRADILIIGVRGECYPCRGDIFEETYELYVENHNFN